MRLSLASLLSLALLGSAHATGVPSTIDQQGRFLKMDGTPETGSLSVTFSVYDAATGGTAAWSEVQALTLDSAGFYAVSLGSATPFPKQLWDGRTLFLGVTVAGESEMA